MGPGIGAAQSLTKQMTPSWNASTTWVHGNHTYKFGADVRIFGYPISALTASNGSFAFSPNQTAQTASSAGALQSSTVGGGTVGFSYASFLLGLVNSGTVNPVANLRTGKHFLGFFAQDTWKITRKLTLDYGLRWDYFTYAREQYGRSTDFSPTVLNSTAGGHPGGTIFEGDGPGHCGCDFAHNYPLAFGPRFGLAYQFNPKTVLRAGIGVAYSSSSGGGQGAAGAAQTVNVPNTADPAMILSGGITNQGQPFRPIWPDIRPNLFPTPNTVSGAPTLVDNNSGKPARQLQWSFGLQREIFRSLVVEASYVANRGVWWRTSALAPYNLLTPAGLLAYGLDITNPADRTILAAQIGTAAAKQFQNRLPYTGFPTTASVAQSLRPFPQFGALTGAGPLGKTWYDSLQAKVTKRFSHGLDASYSFTWAKELQLGADNDGGGGLVNDIFNRDTNKQLSSFSRPFVHIVALSYTVPKWGPQNKAFRFAMSDWTLSSSLQYASGQPFAVPGTAASTTNLTASLLRGTRAERVPGVPLFLADLNCHCFDPAQTQVLNPAAWRDPGTTYNAAGVATAYNGSFSPSAAYYDDFRQQRRPKESLSFGRTFRFKERITLSLRAEMINPFNRVQVPSPNAGIGGVTYATAISTSTAPNGLKVNNSGFGAIATLPAGGAVIGERSGLLVGRLQF